MIPFLVPFYSVFNIIDVGMTPQGKAFGECEIIFFVLTAGALCFEQVIYVA
jgi:hypothetical protein